MVKVRHGAYVGGRVTEALGVDMKSDASSLTQPLVELSIKT